MKTKVTKTSIEAYRLADINGQQQEVFTALRILGEACISDIAAYLNWERSTVSARMNELKDKGCIVFVCKRKSSRTGIMSEHYRIRQVDEPLRLVPKNTQTTNVSQAARILALSKGTKAAQSVNHPMLFDN